MKIIKCWEAIKSPNFDFQYDTVGYFINKQDALDSTEGYGTLNNSDKAIELVQFDSLEEYELYSEIQQLKDNHKKVPDEKKEKLQEYLNNPTILQENNEHKNFIQGWEIKIPVEWCTDKVFGYFTNKEDGIEASHGKGWYGGHGEANGNKPREIIVFENLDEYKKVKEEKNKEIEKMSFRRWQSQHHSGLTFAGISEIGAEKEEETENIVKEKKSSTSTLKGIVSGGMTFVKLDCEEAFKARAERMNRYKHIVDETETETETDDSLVSDSESNDSPEM